MNKELEALKSIESVIDLADDSVDTNTSMGRELEEAILRIRDDFKTLKQALTPPTSDEVIKELWKVFTLADEIYYSDDLKQFYSKKGKLVYPISDYSFSYVGIEYALPPHLIEMIGKFYKSLEKGEQL